MNLSPDWVRELSRGGHDAVHWRGVGKENAPDGDIIAWAAQEDRVVLTADLGFAATVATQGLTAPTVVQLRTGSTDPKDIRELVLRSIRSAGPELGGGAILTIEDDRARLRRGPEATFAD